MQKIKGFTLLEVLISLFLLSFALLAINAAQLSAVHQSRGTYLSLQALMRAQSMAAYLRAHQSEAGDYYHEWRTEIGSVLPQGLAIIEGVYPSYQVKLSWGGKSLAECYHNESGTSGCIMINLGLEPSMKLA